MHSMRLLVLRFSSIGDIILTTPVLRALATQRPGIEVHVATKACYADLLRHSPHVTEVHRLGDDWQGFVEGLRRVGFDAVIDLHGSLRSWRLARALGVPRHCYAKRALARWVMVCLKVNALRDEHVVDRYFRAVRCLGVQDDGEGPELHIPEGRAVVPDALPRSHRSGYTVLAIGAAHFTKRLPVHKLVSLAREIRGPIVLVGGEAEREAAQAIVAAVGARAHDAVGRHDLLGSASLIRGADAVIAHDSAAMHMAVAFRRPLVSVWGGTVPEFGMGPVLGRQFVPSRVVQVQGLACRPCSKHGRSSCPKGHFACMEAQDVVQIARLAREVAGLRPASSELRPAFQESPQELAV